MSDWMSIKNVAPRVFAGSCVAFSLCFLLLAGCEKQPEASGGGRSTSTSGGTVDLTIQFNGRAGDKTVAIPCSADSTVFQILTRARNTGDIEFESTGEGETAFVVSIDEVANEGASGDNWVYLVNDALGDRSCGAYRVEVGDEITWRFGKYEPDE
ncbi:MAG: DUF4430 domain-containing protein [Planctomycetota bacterium]